VTQALADSLVLARRNLLRIPRAPDLLLSFTVQPVMFVLLFAYVFGGAIETPGFDDYKDFLMPGIITQSIAFGGFITAIGLSEDLNKGLTTASARCPWRAPRCSRVAPQPTSSPTSSR